jgi:hypothetical protein
MLCIREAQEAIRPGRAFSATSKTLDWPTRAGRHSAGQGTTSPRWKPRCRNCRLGSTTGSAIIHRPGLRPVGTPGRHLDRRSGRRRHVDRHQLLADIKDIIAITPSTACPPSILDLTEALGEIEGHPWADCNATMPAAQKVRVTLAAQRL